MNNNVLNNIPNMLDANLTFHYNASKFVKVKADIYLVNMGFPKKLQTKWLRLVGSGRLN